MNISRKLLLIGGHAGVGKTSLGLGLQEETGARLVDKDDFEEYTEKLNIRNGLKKNDRFSDKYFSKTRPLEYKMFFNSVFRKFPVRSESDRKLLGENWTDFVIAVAPLVPEYSDAHFVKTFGNALRTAQVETFFVWVDTPSSDELFKRLSKRGKDRDEYKLANWENYWNSLENPVEAIGKGLILPVPATNFSNISGSIDKILDLVGIDRSKIA